MLLKNEGRKIKKILYTAVFIVTIVLFGTISQAYNEEKTVYITIGNETRQVSTMADTVGRLLLEQKITVGPEDLIRPGFDAVLADFDEIFIKKAIWVTVECDGEKIRALTYKDTIQEVLDQLDIILGEKDRIDGMRGDTKIVNGLAIKVIRVTDLESIETAYIPYETQSVENNRMLSSSRKTIQEGKPGVIQNKYEILMENGEIVSKNLSYQKEIRSAVPRIEEYGTLLQYKLPSGETFTYSKVYSMKATAYTLAYEECKKTTDHPYYGITYSGIPVRKGIIAVDPKVIPLGTRVYIETVGKGANYGFSLAADTGTGVKGHIVDLYMEEKEAAIQWGIREVRVYILKDPTE